MNRPSKSIDFSCWRLAHALKKADGARLPNLSEFWLGTAGFLVENAHLFDWSTGQLRLKAGMSDHYVDFLRGSIARRVAQGMALLLLEDGGYSLFPAFVMSCVANPAENLPRQLDRTIMCRALFCRTVRAIECFLKPKAGLCHQKVLPR